MASEGNLVLLIVSRLRKNRSKKGDTTFGIPLFFV
jgi:hypothetical protein